MSMTLACPTTGTGTVGAAFTGSLVVTGGTGPYTYSITLGAIPPGLSLNTSTGVISGFPTTAGSYTWSARVVDNTGAISTTGSGCTTIISGSAPGTCTVAPAPSFSPLLTISTDPSEQQGS